VDAESQLQEAISECYAAPLRFVQIAFDWGRGELEGFDGPDEWQVRFLKKWGDEIRKRRFNGRDSVDPIKMLRSSGHDIGKSALVAWIILFIMSTRPYCRGTVTASSLPQLESKTWPELAKWWRLSINRHWFDWTGSRNNLKFVHKKYPDVWNCFGQSSREENADSFHGQHAASSTSFYIFDESSGVPDAIREVAEGGLADGEPMLFSFGNMTKNAGWFYEGAFGNAKHRYDIECIDSRDTKIANKRLLKEWEEDYGEDSDFFRVRARGLPPRKADRQFIDRGIVEQSSRREVQEDSGSPLILSVDVARFGSNKTVLLKRKGLNASVVGKFQGLDTMQVADRVAREINILNPDAVFIDDAGVGGGVTDRLKQLNFNVIGVNAGSKPMDQRKYLNLRAECWDSMKKWLNDGSIPDDKGLVEGLCAPEYDFNPKNQLFIESKKDMLRRGVESPDEADALAQSFAMPVMRLDIEDDEYEEEDFTGRNRVCGY